MHEFSCGVKQCHGLTYAIYEPEAKLLQLVGRLVISYVGVTVLLMYPTSWNRAILENGLFLSTQDVSSVLGPFTMFENIAQFPTLILAYPVCAI
jgi:hypothetical protein